MKPLPAKVATDCNREHFGKKFLLVKTQRVAILDS